MNNYEQLYQVAFQALRALEKEVNSCPGPKHLHTRYLLVCDLQETLENIPHPDEAKENQR